VLIKENALTLIGRVTNPQEQRISVLIPALPRKWHIQGRAVGSDLGHGCFQFRFEKEEDLQRVLDNRPYHFAYCMVILQRWEPVISATFPSQIPFWIRIKGLPLHFWHEDMICDIGKELGTLMNHELTKTSARIKVLIDGLKPLEKKYIIEYDSGEESLIYLEYEKLENHCSFCQSLSHLKKDCLHFLEGNKTLTSQKKLEESKQLEGQNNYERREPPSDRRNEKIYKDKELNQQYLRLEMSDYNKERSPKAFNDRVDRHGNSFGNRIATKQTRVPPPVKATTDRADTTQNWRSRTHTQEVENQGYVSPPYTNRRDGRRERNYMRAPFPQRGLSEWRIKPTNLHSVMEELEQIQDKSQRTQRDLPAHKSLHQTQGEKQAEEQVLKELDEATRLYLSCPDPTEAAARKQRVMNGDAKGQREETAAFILNSHSLHSTLPPGMSQEVPNNSKQTKEQIMEDLQEVAKQYLSCTDPIEAAARKQRVLTGDASGLMEETSASILAASEPPRRPLSPWERGIRSVSPQAHDNPLNALFLADHTVVLSPQGGEDKEEDTGIDLYYNKISPLQPPVSPRARKTRPQTLKSIIISPSLEGEEESRVPDQQENLTALEREETLQEFQNKVRKTRNLSRGKSSRSSPILLGPSLKKRKLAQLHNSPSGGRNIGEGTSRVSLRRKKAHKAT